MKVMVLVKATKDSEAGVMPTQTLLAEMGKFNEDLVKAGVIDPTKVTRTALQNAALKPPKSTCEQTFEVCEPRPVDAGWRHPGGHLPGQDFALGRCGDQEA